MRKKLNSSYLYVLFITFQIKKRKKKKEKQLLTLHSQISTIFLYLSF